jgi:hypothetical protein
LFYRYALAKFDLERALAIQDNKQFDLAEYLDPTNPNVIQTMASVAKEVAEAQGKSDKAKTEFDKCVSSKK